MLRAAWRLKTEKAVSGPWLPQMWAAGSSCFELTSWDRAPQPIPSALQ